MLRSSFPILEVPDMAAALRFYGDVLGGEVVYRFPPEGETVYLSLAVGGSSLGIGLADGPRAEAASAPVVLWIYVDDVDAATEAARAAGATVLEEPVDQVWGERVSLVADPFGLRVRLGQEPRA
ncbi:MAG TPA: glyoxalase superfamily protein, partial [Naasia sp.]